MMFENDKKHESELMSDVSLPQSPKAGSTAVYNGQPDEMHDLLGAEGKGLTEEDDPLAALRNDPNYSALIRDLEYIASQARLLFQPAEETPSDDLWTKIQSKLGNDPQD